MDEAPAPEAAQLRQLAEICRSNAQSSIRPVAGSVAAGQADATLGDPVALSELLVDLYLEAADRAESDQDIAAIHVLASRAINRLAWIRSDLPELGDNL